jgi:Fe2+ transport system protein FeoA
MNAGHLPGKNIFPLSELAAGEKGRVVYLQTKEKLQIQKLMSIGILPGIVLSVMQRFPAYVIGLGQSQFAIDKKLASAVFVEKMTAQRYRWRGFSRRSPKPEESGE